MDVTVFGPLRSATGEKEVTVAFEGGTVADAVAAFVAAYPRARGHLFDDEGSVRPSVRVSVDGSRVGLDDRCPPDADVTLMPAVQGGRRGGPPPSRRATGDNSCNPHA